MDEASLALTCMGPSTSAVSGRLLNSYNSERLFRLNNLDPLSVDINTGKMTWANPRNFKVGSALRLGGNILGGVGIGYSFYQIGTNQVPVGDGLTNVGFGLIGFAGSVDAIISGLYFTDQFI